MTDYVVPNVKITIHINNYRYINVADNTEPIVEVGEGVIKDHDLVMNSMLRVSRSTPMTKMNGIGHAERNNGFARGITDIGLVFRIPTNSESVDYMNLCMEAKADLLVTVEARNPLGFYIHGEKFNHVRIDSDGYTVTNTNRSAPMIEFTAQALTFDFKTKSDGEYLFDKTYAATGMVGDGFADTPAKMHSDFFTDIFS